MYNLHPVLSAFPLVLLSLLCFAEILYFYRRHEFWQSFAKVILLLAVFFTVLAFFFGYLAAAEASKTFDVANDVIANHHNFGRLLLFLEVPLLILFFLKGEKKLLSGLYYLNLLSVLLLVFYTGYLGAELVFSYGAGVEVE